MGGESSYTELLTPLDMAPDVRQPKVKLPAPRRRLWARPYRLRWVIVSRRCVTSLTKPKIETSTRSAAGSRRTSLNSLARRGVVSVRAATRGLLPAIRSFRR